MNQLLLPYFMTPWMDISGFMTFHYPDSTQVHFDIDVYKWDQGLVNLMINNLRLCCAIQDSMLPLITAHLPKRKNHLKLICSDGRFVG